MINKKKVISETERVESKSQPMERALPPQPTFPSFSGFPSFPSFPSFPNLQGDAKAGVDKDGLQTLPTDSLSHADDNSPLPAKPNGKEYPRHIAIILDGNRRWAKLAGKQAVEGHREGSLRIADVVDRALKMGIEFLTFYVFSSENWKREKSEKEQLFKLLIDYLYENTHQMQAKGIRMKFIGNIDGFSSLVQKSIHDAEEKTAHCKNMTIQIALGYGGRDEIIRATKKAIALHQQKKISIDDVDEKLFSSLLDTTDIPDPDLLIRTGGEKRVSNFLLYQNAYAELFFTKTLWPEFTSHELDMAVNDYLNRERRFGSG